MAIVTVAVEVGEVVEVDSAVAVEFEGSAVEAEVVDEGSVAVVALVMVIGSGKCPLHRATVVNRYKIRP